MQTLVMGEVGGFWSDHVQHNALLLTFALLLAGGIIMLRLWYQRRQHEKFVVEDDAEVALLNSEYEDAPPAYARIPIIKIEEFD
jgi:hypothetical protein